MLCVYVVDVHVSIFVLLLYIVRLGAKPDWFCVNDVHGENDQSQLSGVVQSSPSDVVIEPSPLCTFL